MAEEVKREPGNDVIPIWVSAARDDELVIAHVPLTQLIATLPVDLSAVSFLLLPWLSARGHPRSSMRVVKCFAFVFLLSPEEGTFEKRKMGESK